MRKLLLTLAVMCGTVSGWAEVTKFYKPGERLATLTPGQKVMFYNTCLPDGQDRTGFLIDNGSSLNLVKSKPSTSPIFSEKEGVWTIETASLTGNYYTVNVKGSNGYLGIGGKTNNTNAQVMLFHEWTTAAAGKKAGVNSENAAGEKVNNADISTDDKVWLVTNADQSTTWNGNQTSFATWGTGHPYAIYSVVEATTAELNTILADAKTEAVNELNALKQLSVIYTKTETAIAAVEAVALENNDLETALSTINTLVAGAKAEANGKNVKFCNKSGDARGGKYLGYDKANNRAAAVADGGDAAIWTIKLNPDGTFKLYNWVNNHYLGTPADPTPVVAAEANAPSFKFISTATNEVAIVTGDKMVHIANQSNYKVIHYWSTTDKASLWDVTVVPEIVVTHEKYNAAVEAAATLPYAIQKAYGLVTDAKNYYSNYKSTAEGSYDALLDNTESSYFHSAYNSEPGDGSGVHYIQADLGEGNSVDEFYFYMKPRSGNGNNRPKNITVSGSNDINGEFTKIADVTTTLDGSMNPYISAKLGTDGTNYRYIRLTVTSTNTSTKFFTLSELYFFPANNDVISLVGAYNALSTSSITSNEMAPAIETLINAASKLALSNIKKEISALLTANESNHTDAPQLGQYTTEGYNALLEAYNAQDATEESLENAIADFKKSLNRPVYFITSAWNAGYSKGSAIYYDGSWKWKTSNIYDRQMWMTIPGYTQPNVPVVDAYDAEGTSYEICDYLTGTLMRNKKVQIVKIADWDGAYNLQYNADANSTDAAQHAKDNGQLVNWKPATSTDSKASAWHVEYIGNSFNLDKLTDEKIEALASMRTAYATKVHFKDAVLGNALGQYQGDKETIVVALTKAETVFEMSLVELANMTIEAINAITNEINAAAVLVINQPISGKFYRIKGGVHTSLPNHYITGNTNTDGGRIALKADGTDASTVYYYADGKLLAYSSGLYFGLSASHYVFATVDGSKPASAITFAASPREAGAYTIKSADRYVHYNIYNGEAEIDRCVSDVHAEHDWFLEDVTTLPVTITSAGYATFYAPVAVEIPEGVEAYYTAEVDGEYITLTKIEGVIPANTGVIPANTGVILKGDANTYNFNIVADVDAVTGNKLAGTVASAYVTEDAYVLSKQDEVVGMYKAAKNQQGNTWLNNGFKAYLPASVFTAGARFLVFDFGTETGIDQLEGENSNVKTEVYDLSGRRVQSAQKGIFIVNGKKVIR